MACDAQTLIASAMGNGYAALSDRDLKMATLASACAGGGGGGGGNTNTIQTTDPVGSGTTTGDFWINKNTNGTWFWTGATWQALIAP